MFGTKRSRIESLIKNERVAPALAIKKEKLDTKEASMKETISALYKMRRLAGDMGDKLRVKMQQAGYRSPSAPLVFLIIKAILQLLFTFIAMGLLAMQAEPLSSGLQFMIIAGAALFGFYLPGLMLKNTAVKRQQEIAVTFPDALDMILICVQGGIGIEQTIDRIAKEMNDHSQVLSEELSILSAELALLNDRKKAFQKFAARVGSGAARSFATAMIQAEQYGTSISQAMRVLAEDQRDQRMAEAERKAAALPPKLTVPMILFFLPALFIVILGPAGIQAASM